MCVDNRGISAILIYNNFFWCILMNNPFISIKTCQMTGSDIIHSHSFTLMIPFSPITQNHVSFTLLDTNQTGEVRVGCIQCKTDFSALTFQCSFSKYISFNNHIMFLFIGFECITVKRTIGIKYTSIFNMYG